MSELRLKLSSSSHLVNQQSTHKIMESKLDTFNKRFIF